MPETVGLVKTYVKAFASVSLCASGLVTATLTIPAVWAGVRAVIEFSLSTRTFVAGAPPKLSVAPAARLLPLTVIAVPPIVDPEAGVIPVMTGVGSR